MSGALSVLGTLSSLVTGGPLFLGPIVFYSFEVPDRINFGGETKLVVHKMPGGQRIIDAMGDDPVTPAWSGKLSGAFASTRARQINALRNASKPINLSFGPFSAQVVIKKFEAQYERQGYWIPYQIVCEVIPPTPGAVNTGGTALAGLIGADAANALNDISAAAAQVQDIAATATSYASAALSYITPVANLVGINLGGVTAALNTGSGIVAGVANLALAPSVAANAFANFQSAASGIGASLSTLGNGLTSIGGTATAAGLGDPASSIADLNNAAAITGANANLVQAGAQAAVAAQNAGSVTNQITIFQSH